MKQKTKQQLREEVDILRKHNEIIREALREVTNDRNALKTLAIGITISSFIVYLILITFIFYG